MKYLIQLQQFLLLVNFFARNGFSRICFYDDLSGYIEVQDKEGDYYAIIEFDDEDDLEGILNLSYEEKVAFIKRHIIV
jgi:hypothetical protein